MRFKGIIIVLILTLFTSSIYAQDKNLAAGKKALDGKNYKLAIEELSKVVKKDKKNKLAYYYRGLAYLYSDKFSFAIDDFTNYIAIDPTFPDAYNNRGLAYSFATEFRTSIEDFTKAIELDPKFSQAYTNRGTAHVNLREHDPALSDLTKAIELNENNPAAYYQRGSVNYILFKYKNAIADFTAALSKGISNPKLFYNRGNSYFKLKDFDNAIADYTNSIKYNPNNIEALNNRAMAYDMKGDSARADKDRKLLIKKQGYEKSFKPIEEIKFKTFISKSKELSCELPEDWHLLEVGDSNYVELYITMDSIASPNQPFSIGMKISLNKNMDKVYGISNPGELLDFYRGSLLKNAETYYKYDIFQQRTLKKGSYEGFNNKVSIQFNQSSYPLRLYEICLTKPKTLVFVYCQASEMEFAHFQKIFDKAVKSLSINY